MLVQALRAFLPIGAIWNPILDDIVQFINFLQSEALKRVAFYRATTDFANDLKMNSTYSDIQVTGHSLGGGIAIITGSQSQIPAVALSGPNAKLSGSSFTPKVTHEQLEHYTFNIIPARDPVARFDDKSTQYQNIRCEAAANNFADCHSAKRSLCEILYTCGSGNRPVYCLCHKLGYPKPTPYPGARDYDVLCPQEDQ